MPEGQRRRALANARERFTVMEKLHANYPVGALAEALEISRSGFYSHRRKPGRPRRVRDAQLAPLIAQSFARSRRTDGSPRVLCDLCDLGERCGKNRVARLMRAQVLRARQKRRFRPRTADSRHGHPIAANWLAKVPAPDAPGMVWQSDFTYVETAGGWLYLAFTLDACTRRCVAQPCRADMRGELTTATLALAMHRQPPPPGLLHLRAPSGAALRAKAPPFGYLCHPPPPRHCLRFAPLGSATAACNTPPPLPDSPPPAASP